jgi:hypothetical protein
MSLIVADDSGQLHATELLDRWRRDYQSGLTSRVEVAAVYETLSHQFPEQNYFDTDAARVFVARYEPNAVVELGGWDGALARELLRRFPTVSSWDNYEIAFLPQVCADPRYTFHTITSRWVWQEPIVGDAFIASHVLEHISDSQLGDLIDAIDCDVAFVDVPLGNQRHDWMRSPTTHVLTLSIDEFDAAWESRGWKIAFRKERAGAVPSHVRYLERTT